MNSFRKTGGFCRHEHLKDSKDIKTIYRDGKRVSIGGIKLFYRTNDRPHNRIACTLPRGYGNAVERNYSKRLSREAYRHMKHQLAQGYDFLLLVYPGGDSFEKRRGQLCALFRKAGLIIS